ncbi:MAG: PEP-CTERM sorting domain-containing protein [Bryobacteraceae bacterium]|jgi:hypothetical protein
MRVPGVNHLVLLVLAVVGIASRSDAATIITVPLNLNPGDIYRLVFFTSTLTDATSTDINYYNNFVTLVADTVPALVDLGATWTVIGSTATVDAKTNIGDTASGIYTLDGTEVAAGTAELFSPETSPLLSPIEIDQNGHMRADYVFTGGRSGISDGAPLGGAYTLVGATWATSSAWIEYSAMPASNRYSLYAISSELTVTVPEPTTIGLTALAGAILLLARRRKRKGQ